MKRCQQCLIPAGISLLQETYAVSEDTPGAEKVSLKDNRCQFCRSFNRHFDPAYLRQEVTAFVQSDKPVLVAVSGGKDSLTALFLAKEVLGLQVSALTLDNGFIPKQVLDFTAKTCKKLDIPWTRIEHPLYREFLDEYQPDEAGIWQAKTGLDFCTVCAKQIHLAIREWAIEHDAHRIILGNRTHTHLDPRVSCLDIRNFTHNNRKYAICYINLLFGLSVSNTRQQRILNELGWEDPGLPGFTSNCKIPGFVEQARRRRLGFGTDTGYLENELRCGAHTLEEAQKLMEELESPDLSEEITEFFKSHKLKSA